MDTEEITEAIGGRILSENSSVLVKSICIDSREVVKGSLFVAIKGNRVDGHDYILDAVKRGAVAVLVEREVELIEEVVVILVDDNYAALQSLTKYFRKNLDIPIIALTGSSGKTTTKDIIYSILSQK